MDTTAHPTCEQVPGVTECHHGSRHLPGDVDDVLHQLRQRVAALEELAEEGRSIRAMPPDEVELAHLERLGRRMAGARGW